MIRLHNEKALGFGTCEHLRFALVSDVGIRM